MENQTTDSGTVEETEEIPANEEVDAIVDEDWKEENAETYVEYAEKEKDPRTKETLQSKLILGNPKRQTDWRNPRVSPIKSMRNKVDPETGKKYKILEHRERKRARKSQEN